MFIEWSTTLQPKLALHSCMSNFLLKFLSILLYVFRMADSLVSRHGASDEYHDPYCEPCDESRGKNVKAKCFCKNCNQFLCSECHTVHGRLMATKGHVIQTALTCHRQWPISHQGMRFVTTILNVSKISFAINMGH